MARNDSPQRSRQGSLNFKTFEDIDFSAEFKIEQNYQSNDPSPSHDSQSSGLFSPLQLGDENELENDADSDSSGENLTFASNRIPDRRKTKRRASSNLFTLKSNNDEDITNSNLEENLFVTENGKHELHTGVLKSRRDLLKWTTSQSFSSSTEDYEFKSSQGSNSYKTKTLHINQNNHDFSTSGSEEGYLKNTLINVDDSPKSKAVDGLLFEIYDKYHHNGPHILDSDVTELSTTSVTSIYIASSFENDDRTKLDRNYLETKELPELERMVKELKRGISMLNSKLVRLLKQRDRNAHKIQENFNVLTALLQARSQKRRVDTRIRFSFIPRPGKQGFRQWVDALKAVSRIHEGIPAEWRKRTWLSLAEFFLKGVEWDSIKKMCFNDKRNPDDDELDTQIVKDLHRTGCDWFFEHDTAEDRASLKRVLLAYARWNKQIGYCQGFNVIAALILQVMEGNEEHALKVMIYLVDYILPRNYFSNNLRALSVDMAVLRDLMQIKLASLARNLQQLQKDAMNSEQNTSASYEPPLINMFTMQWFLTLFATCLPRNTVLRIWDTVLLEGSEVLLRVALSIWAKLESSFDHTSTAADFYMTMGRQIQSLMTDDFIPIEKLMQTVYQMAPFPWSEVSELREKYTYDIHPFTTFRADKKKEARNTQKHVLKPPSDEEDTEENNDDIMVGCLGFVAGTTDNQLTLSPNKQKMIAGRHENSTKKSPSRADITKISPGAYITDQEARNAYKEQMRAKELIRESEKLDLGKLRNQYGRMRRLQQKAMLVFNAEDFKDDTYKMKNPPSAINHLFVDVHNVTAPPRARYRKPSNFPALKAPKKGGTVPSLPKPKNSAPRVSDDKNTTSTATAQRRKQSDSFSITNPYVMLEVQGERPKEEVAFKDPDAHARMVHRSASVNAIKTAPSKALSAPIRKDDETNSELRSLSPLYKIDKSALYPSNFKPFPKRNIGKRKAQGK